MSTRHYGLALSLVACLTLFGTSISTADPSFEQTARYLLDVVKAFRTAYVLHIVEHTREGGTVTREDWEKDAHFLPLPAQFVKAAAGQVDTVDIGLISMTPINPENRPRTAAEADALMQLEKDRQRGFITFGDGDQFKAVSADLALVPSCVECHNHHPKSVRKNYQQWDVMGALVVRFKRDAELSGAPLPAEPSRRPSGSLDRHAPPAQAPPPWMR
jgi:hypothetical protein